MQCLHLPRPRSLGWVRAHIYIWKLRLLLLLDHVIEFSSNVAPVCLPFQAVDEDQFKEDYFEVIGWENTKQDSTLNLYSRQVYILLIKKEGDCIVLMQKFKDWKHVGYIKFDKVEHPLTKLPI